MTDLLADLYAEIDRRETNAKAAADHEGGGGWTVQDLGLRRSPSVFSEAGWVADLDPPTADHIADNDPAHVLRGHAEDRDILRRHADDRASGRHWCYVVGEDGRGRLLTILPNECPEVLSVARRLGVEVPS